MRILRQLGMRKNWVYEAVVASGDKERKNAAPMGIKTRDYSSIELSVYKSAGTCANILMDGCFTVNLSSSPQLMHRSLFKKRSIAYSKSRKVSAPSIKGADAVLEARVRKSRDVGDRIVFDAEVVSYKKRKGRSVSLINRADSLLLEALIKATRIPDSDDREKERLLEDIRCISAAAQRVAPGSLASLALEEVLACCG